MMKLPREIHPFISQNRFGIGKSDQSSAVLNQQRDSKFTDLEE